jgi:hypothetical protein
MLHYVYIAQLVLINSAQNNRYSHLRLTVIYYKNASWYCRLSISKIKQNIPLAGLLGPEGSGRLRFPDSVTSALESGRLSALCTGRLYPQEYLGTHILRGWTDSGHMELSEATEKILSDTTGDRSRERSALTITPPQARRLSIALPKLTHRLCSCFIHFA